MLEEPIELTIRREVPRPTSAQVAAFEGVPTGHVCDAMDGRGALDVGIAPLMDGHVVGPALVAENGPEGVLATLGAIHACRPGDVVVAAMRGGVTAAAAGDLVMGMLRNAGAAGFVTDGAMRDAAGIRAAGLPAWCAGLTPNSPYMRAPGRVGYGAAVGGVRVESGDLIVADEDGVAVVPLARIDAVIARLAQVRAAEADMEAKVAAGFREQTLIAQMLADGRAVMAD